MFKYLCKNKKGISLMELVIAVSLVGFVTAIAGQLLFNFTRTYNIAQRRWEIQTAVKLACTKFETNKDSIVNAYKADLLYDKALEAGIVYNTETKAVTWNEASKVMPTEGIRDNDNIYTYIFSVPAVDQNGNDLGSFLFIRDFDATDSVLFLNNEGMGEVPVDIAFRVAKSPTLLERETLEPKADQDYRYLTSTVEIDFMSGAGDITNYEVITQFTLYNFNGRAMTMEGSYPVLEEAWLGNVYPAGWSLGSEVSGMPNTTVPYIISRNPLKYCDAAYSQNCTEYMTKDANMMRFVSERAVDAKGSVDELAPSAQFASCLTKFLFSDGTKNGARTIGALRDFRDNVLKGNAFGDWFIAEYYNTWSPALVKACGEHEWLKGVLKTLISPVSKVLGVISCE